jgi:hypothetical protein
MALCKFHKLLHLAANQLCVSQTRNGDFYPYNEDSAEATKDANEVCGKSAA